MTTNVNKTLLHYPAHGDNFFMVCTPGALKLMTSLACHHGCNADLIMETASYQDLLKGHARVLKQLKQELSEKYVNEELQKMEKKLGVKINPKICIGESLAKSLKLEEEDVITTDDTQLVYGPELADRPLDGWEMYAIMGFLETELGYTVKPIGYGSVEHEPWASFVQD